MICNGGPILFALETAELCDSAAGKLTATADKMTTSRASFAAMLLR
jgi:hypothetical protein